MPPKKLTKQEMFDLQVYDYLMRKNMQNSAATFAREVGLNLENGQVPDAVPGGFLKDWFDINSDIFQDLFVTTNNLPQAAAQRTILDRILKDLTPREVKVQVPEPSTSSTQEEAVNSKLQDLDEASSGMNQQKKKREK